MDWLDDHECKCDYYHGEWMTCHKCTWSLEDDYFEAMLRTQDASICSPYILDRLKWFAGMSAEDQAANRASVRKLVLEHRYRR